MEILHDIFQAEIIQRLGWTLLHFVWQAAAIGIALAIVLKLLRKSSANLRYAVGCMAMVLIVVIPAVTITQIGVSPDIVSPEASGPVEMPPVATNTVLVTEMPQLELPPVEFTAIPKVALKDRFINTVEPALPYMVIGWLVGVFGLSLWYLGGWGQLQKLRRQMVKQVTPAIKAKLQRLADALAIQKAVAIVESALVQVPMVVGHLKPVILLPASALTGLSGEQIEAILAHELAHIKRCDYLVNMLQTVVEILGFYHPAVWWVSGRIRAERENCCDDIAVSLCNDRVCYAKALATMEDIRSSGAGFAMAASGGSLLMRIKRLVGKDSPNEGKLSWLPSAVAMVLITGLLIPVCFAMGNKSGSGPDEIKNDSQVGTEFKKILANGVTVELVGVCEHPIEGKQWWKPDGKALLDVPFDYSGDKVSAYGNERAFDFAVRYTNMPEGMDSIFYAEPLNNRVGGTLHSSVDKSGKKLHKYEAGRLVSKVAHMATLFDKKQKMCVFKIGIADGPWKTNFESTKPETSDTWGTSSLGFIKGGVIFGKPMEENRTIWISVTHTIDRQIYDIRIVAIHKDGSELKAIRSDGGSVGEATQDTVNFDLPLEYITSFRVQIRKYEWITFKNVFLEPDFEDDGIRVYQVNSSVSDFPEEEDFSTPESAYAAINRVMAGEDWYAWQRVSVKRLANVLAGDAKQRQGKKVDPEWSNVVLNARILEVRIKDNHAVVIAKLPQKLSSKPIKEPIDYRHLELEDGKWLNTGENRYDSIEQARAKFDKMVEKQSTETSEQLKIEQKYSEAVNKPEMLSGMAEELFDKIRKANYDKILSYYDKQTGKWKRDGWKKLGLDYMVNTDWPSFAVWVCKTFKDNPIESVELGDVFISDKKVHENTKAPAVPYKLVLQDGGVLEGDLYFVYWDKSGKWQAAEGIDWHLQDELIKRPDVPAGVGNNGAGVYQVNRNVSDFPKVEDFSTPEAAYVTTIRIMASGQRYRWKDITIEKPDGLLDELSEKDNKDVPSDLQEWWLNTVVKEVMISGNRAAVIGQRPSTLQGEIVQKRLDYREYAFENGKWLYTFKGGRFETMDKIKEKFQLSSEEKWEPADQNGKIADKIFMPGGGDEKLMLQLKDSAKGISDCHPDDDRRQIAIETRVLTVNETFLEDVGIDLAAEQGDIVKAEGGYFLGEPKNSQGLEREVCNGQLDDIQVELIIRGTQLHKDSKVLTSPKILLFDGDEGSIHITKKSPCITGYNESKGFLKKPEPKIDEIEEGVKLEILPTIIDGDNIDMHIDFTQMEILDKAKEKYKGNYIYKLPTMETTNIESRVVVSDGSTILLGGIPIQPSEEGSESQILLLLIKPTIVTENDQVISR